MWNKVWQKIFKIEIKERLSKKVVIVVCYNGKGIKFVLIVPKIIFWENCQMLVSKQVQWPLDGLAVECIAVCSCVFHTTEETLSLSTMIS